MTQLIINVEDKTLLPTLKKLINSMQGVSIAKCRKQGKSGIEEAYDDIRAGRINKYDNADVFFKAVGI